VPEEGNAHYARSRLRTHSPPRPLAPQLYAPHAARARRAIDILHCGVCHSPAHRAQRLGQHRVPLRARHEIVAACAHMATGVEVQSGRHLGVGCMSIAANASSPATTARAVLRKRVHRHLQRPRAAKQGPTRSRYSINIIVHERFVLRVCMPKSTCHRRATAVRGHHHLFAAAQWKSAGPKSCVGSAAGTCAPSHSQSSRHVTSPPRPTTPTFWPAHLHWRSGE